MLSNKNPFGLFALWRAYRACRKGKRTTRDTQRYEVRLLDHLVSSRDALARFAWRPSRTLAFVVSSPKLREIHAAPFADRVVHHLLTDRLARIYEPVFIHDSYANRVGKGTHAAVARLQAFMRQAVACVGCAEARSATGAPLKEMMPDDVNVALRCAQHNLLGASGVYALQLDIANFFNSIHRPTLFSLLQQRLVRAVRRQGLEREEASALQAHCRALLQADPAAGVRRKGSPGLFEQVPPHKRLGALGPGVGLPIGNLTSQFFANVYLNELDQFVKHTLKARWYVRYVDDFVLLHPDPEQLLIWRGEIERFLAERLRLKLKARAEPKPVAAGVDFLGYVIRPFYKLVRRRVIHRLYARLAEFERRHVRPNALRLPPDARDLLRAQVASYLGHLRHAHAHRLWLRTLERFPWLNWLFDQPENALGSSRRSNVGSVGCAERSEAQHSAPPNETSPNSKDVVLRCAQHNLREDAESATCAVAVGCAERSEAQHDVPPTVTSPPAGGVVLRCAQHNLREAQHVARSLPRGQSALVRQGDAPIGRIDAACHEAREGGMGPVGGRGGETVLDRVPVDVIAMAGEIAIVPQPVLPIAPLPDSLLAPFAGARALCRVRQAAGEIALDQIPAQGEIGIRLGERPDAMQMVGQQHQGIDAERMISHDSCESRPQTIHVRPVGEQRAPLESDQREEKRSTGGIVATITHPVIVNPSDEADVGCAEQSEAQHSGPPTGTSPNAGNVALRCALPGHCTRGQEHNLRPAWEPTSVSGLAGQYRAFASRYPAACVLTQVGKNWLAAGEQVIPLSRQPGMVPTRRPGLGDCLEFPAYRLAQVRQKLKRAAIPHILVAQTGTFKTGFKRRAMVLIWYPAPDPLNSHAPWRRGLAPEVFCRGQGRSLYDPLNPFLSSSHRGPT